MTHPIDRCEADKIGQARLGLPVPQCFMFSAYTLGGLRICSECLIAVNLLKTNGDDKIKTKLGDLTAVPRGGKK